MVDKLANERVQINQWEADSAFDRTTTTIKGIKLMFDCWKSNHKVRDQRLLSSSQTKSFCEDSLTWSTRHHKQAFKIQGGRWFLSRCQIGMLLATFVIIVLVSDAATRTQIKFLAGSYWPLTREETWGLCWPMRGPEHWYWPIRGHLARCKWWHGKSG